MSGTWNPFYEEAFHRTDITIDKPLLGIEFWKTLANLSEFHPKDHSAYILDSKGMWFIGGSHALFASWNYLIHKISDFKGVVQKLTDKLSINSILIPASVWGSTLGVMYEVEERGFDSPVYLVVDGAEYISTRSMDVYSLFTKLEKDTGIEIPVLAVHLAPPPVDLTRFVLDFYFNSKNGEALLSLNWRVREIFSRGSFTHIRLFFKDVISKGLMVSVLKNIIQDPSKRNTLTIDKGKIIEVSEIKVIISRYRKRLIPTILVDTEDLKFVLRTKMKGSRYKSNTSIQETMEAPNYN